MLRSIFALSILFFSLTIHVVQAQVPPVSPNINQVGHAFSWWSRYPCSQECGTLPRGSTLEDDGASYVFKTNFCQTLTSGCPPPPITFISLQSNYVFPEQCVPTPFEGCFTRKEFKFGFLEATSPTVPGGLITNPIRQLYPDLSSGDFVMSSRELFPLSGLVGPRYHSKFIISNNSFGSMIFATTSPENTSPVANEHYQSKRIEIGAYGDVTIGGTRDVYGIPQEWKGVLHVTRRNNSNVLNTTTPSYMDEQGHGGVCAIVSRFETSTDAPHYVRLISLGVGDPNAWMTSRDATTGAPNMTNQLAPREEVFTVWRNGTTIIAPPTAPDALTGLTPEDGALLTVKGMTISQQLAARNGFYVGTIPNIGFSTNAAGNTTTKELTVGPLSPKKFFVNSDGKLILGPPQTGGPHNDCLLSANGKIVAKEIVVTVKNWQTWPDYVFYDNYDLMPLSDLERFIKQNKHLPSVPTTSEVKENGISVGDMNELLLKKIEELTLYVIQLKKEMQELQNEKTNKE